jgi:hypothetical protein
MKKVFTSCHSHTTMSVIIIFLSIANIRFSVSSAVHIRFSASSVDNIRASVAYPLMTFIAPQLLPERASVESGMLNG